MDRPLHVLQVTGLAGPEEQAGGVWEVARTQSIALREAGHHVTTLAGWLGRLPDNQESRQVVLVRLRRPLAKGDLRGVWSLRLIPTLIRLSRSADISHVHLCRDFVTTAAALLLRVAGVPIVAQTHGMVAKPTSTIMKVFDSVVFGRALKSVDLFLSLNDSEVSALEAMGIDDSKIRMIPNAVFASDPARAGESVTDAHFLFASRLHARKQPHVFVEAAALAVEKGSKASFTVAGPDQGEGPRIDRLVREKGLDSIVKVLGPVDHSMLMEQLEGVTAVVLPSLDEPYGMIVLEAASSRTPAIISPSCAIASILRDNCAAKVVEPDCHAVSEAMLELEADPVGTREMGERAREVYDRLWRPEGLARILIELYGLVIGRRRQE